MSSINTGKVITGGLLAGLVFNILDFVIQGVIMKPEFDANAARLGLDPALQQSPPLIASWVVVDFIFGLVTVFTYAAIRPRFGPGVKTAIIAGVIPWLSVVAIMFGLTQSAFFPMGIYGKMLVFSFINTCVGSVAGAWVYKEEPARGSSAAVA